MFLRKNRRRIDGETYEYWTLCESVRTERGPRQRVVATLGKLDDDDPRAGWDPIEGLLDGRQPGPRQPELPNGTPEATPQPGAWELANLSRIEVGRVREFGSVFLGLALWRRLGLHEFLDSLIEPGREEVAWAGVAAVLTVGTFCGQASELGIAESWYARTALEDIAGIPADAVNNDRLCRALDKVGAHKDRLCAYEAELAEKENWVEVQHGVEARLVAHPDGDGRERFVLCRSTARGAKERAMDGPVSGGGKMAEGGGRPGWDGTGDRAGAELPGAGGRAPEAGKGCVPAADPLHGDGSGEAMAVDHAADAGGGGILDGQERHGAEAAEGLAVGGKCRGENGALSFGNSSKSQETASPTAELGLVWLCIDAPPCQAWVVGETKGVALQGVNQGDFRRMPLPVPLLAKQRRILGKVDQVLAMVDALETQLAASRATAANLLSALVAELTSPQPVLGLGLSEGSLSATRP